MRRGQAVARAALELRRGGFVPDIVCVHPGWGEGLYLKDVFAGRPLLSFFEFYYHARGADVGFDPEYPGVFDDGPRLRTRNALHLINLEACDWGTSPTSWQRQLHPAVFRPKISTIHDGIDTEQARPDPRARLRLENAGGLELGPADEVVTYVARNLEPYRGFHSFMRTLPLVLARRPRAQVVIVGEDGVSYGVTPRGGKTYRQIMMEEVGSDLDRTRVHFLGRVPYARFLQVLQVSAVHVYLTYPFVLSWSMLEAMAAGCAVVASATAPVEEVIRHTHNGLLVDFFSSSAIADAIDSVLDHPDRMRAMRERARADVVERYDFKRVWLPRQLQLIATLAAGRRPAPEPP